MARQKRPEHFKRYSHRFVLKSEDRGEAKLERFLKTLGSYGKSSEWMIRVMEEALAREYPDFPDEPGQ